MYVKIFGVSGLLKSEKLSFFSDLYRYSLTLLFQGNLKFIEQADHPTKIPFLIDKANHKCKNVNTVFKKNQLLFCSIFFEDLRYNKDSGSFSDPILPCLDLRLCGYPAQTSKSSKSILPILSEPKFYWGTPKPDLSKKNFQGKASHNPLILLDRYASALLRVHRDLLVLRHAQVLWDVLEQPTGTSIYSYREAYWAAQNPCLPLHITNTDMWKCLWIFVPTTCTTVILSVQAVLTHFI